MGVSAGPPLGCKGACYPWLGWWVDWTGASPQYSVLLSCEVNNNKTEVNNNNYLNKTTIVISLETPNLQDIPVCTKHFTSHFKATQSTQFE